MSADIVLFLIWAGVALVLWRLAVTESAAAQEPPARRPRRTTTTGHRPGSAGSPGPDRAGGPRRAAETDSGTGDSGPG
ncbi:hypothetical protein [Nocardia stercoris]|uniref:Uncharacterized protein n=1 Tax=Nocardia stercoris TaxID=2483361 RepID=A0A3M2L7M6_9NOCA|nr:hypothetical protein [Nocardia stercoris]RMI33547.1 hypothetical protein EBN03_10565 [Nocardia stercoris]